MIKRLDHFIHRVVAAVEEHDREPDILERVIFAMADLVAVDDWLAPELALPDPRRYRQYLLHRDKLNRFSLVSFVWGPGQSTPIHDHLTWGVIGMLRGAECAQVFRPSAEGMTPFGNELRLNPGSVSTVSPRLGDIHRVRNAYDDRVSISIHAYGADIGRQKRHVFDPLTGNGREFISGYSNSELVE